MEDTQYSNPILPAAGVRRNNQANDSACLPPLGWQNDDGSVNLLGRGEPSEEGTVRMPKRAVLRCKKPFIMATFNANTARDEARAMEIAQCASACGVEILGIQEHRRVHGDPLVFSRIEGMYLVTSSAWRNEAQASMGGVGVLLGARARKTLRSVKSHSERILLVELDSNPVTTVIVAYSPTNVAPSEVVEKFYDELGGAVKEVPAHNFLVVLGDLNARLGSEYAPFTYHDETNRNGELLAEFMVEHQLLAANTLFQKKMGKRWTFKCRATGMLRQLDYILVRRKWRNSVLNAEPYSSFQSTSSDHRVVSMRVRLSLRVPKSNNKSQYNWKEFSTRTDLQDRYTVVVRNRFQMLEDENPTVRYERFIKANEEARKECVSEKVRSRKPLRSRHHDVVVAREAVNEAKQFYDRDQTEENKSAWKVAQKELFNTYDRLKEEELLAMVQRIEAEHGGRQYGEAWTVINEITGRKKSKEGQVSGVSPDERVTTWFTHFSNLLGSAPDVVDAEEEIPDILIKLDIDDGPFTAAELANVKVSLKQGKAAGPDCIPPEVFRNCDLDDIVLEICNLALIKNEKPEQWSSSNIIPVPKSGTLSNTNNYRGIGLTCVAAKMYNRMILNRLRNAIDPHLRNNQNGFRKGRSTVEQILALRRIIEEVKRHNLSAVLTFIDFKKAFDSIHRAKMIKILKAYGVPPNLLRAIESMYANTRAKVITPDGETEWFNIMAGVLQGDTLAPFLFIVVLDFALRRAISGHEAEFGFTITPRRSRRHPAVVQTDLDFADDIALVTNEVGQAQDLLTRVEEECKRVGLRLNVGKTEVICYNTPEHTRLKTMEGRELEEVDDFKYLGSWVDSTEKDIKVRKAKAWRALNDMKTIWGSDMSRDVKISFFIATVESVLLYGCESWTLTPTLQKSINGCYTRMLRVVLNVSWWDHVTNVVLYGKLPQVGDKIAARRMQLAGHCHRHPELPAHHTMLWEPTHGRRGRGRPKLNYVDVLKKDAGVETTGELGSLMQDRKVWGRHAHARLRPP